MVSLPCDGGYTIHKLCLVENIGIIEHAVLERDNDELRFSEVGAKHLPDVLCVREIESCVYFIQNVDRSWLEEKEREDERESNQRPMCVRYMQCFH